MPLDVIARDAAAICERVNLDALSGKTILVTGASGLLGTYFLATLAHLKQSGLPLQAIAQVRSEPAPHTAEIIQRGGFQLAQNLAVLRSVLRCRQPTSSSTRPVTPSPVFMANPVATFQVNTTATATLLQKLKPGGSFLFLSSSEVYSGLKKSPVTESDIGTTTPLHPRACYIEGKRGGETICNAYRSQGVRATVRAPRTGLRAGHAQRRQARAEFLHREGAVPGQD